MNFANPHMLWLLLVIPPALLAFFWWAARLRRRLLTQFIQARLLPALEDRVAAKAIRVPVSNVSAIDLVTTLSRRASAIEINARLRGEAEAGYPGLLACTDEPHASIDFNHSLQSAIVDTGLTQMSGERLANLFIWFDNEWGFANRMLELAAFWGRRLPGR